MQYLSTFCFIQDLVIYQTTCSNTQKIMNAFSALDRAVIKTELNKSYIPYGSKPPIALICSVGMCCQYSTSFKAVYGAICFVSLRHGFVPYMSQLRQSRVVVRELLYTFSAFIVKKRCVRATEQPLVACIILSMREKGIIIVCLALDR